MIFALIQNAHALTEPIASAMENLNLLAVSFVLETRQSVQTS